MEITKNKPIKNRLEDIAVFCNYINVLSLQLGDNIENFQDLLHHFGIDKATSQLLSTIGTLNFMIEDFNNQLNKELDNIIQDCDY